LWVLGVDADADAELTGAGMRSDRELYEMRVPLPLGLEVRWPPGIAVRMFEPGRDDDAWLAVNNRAFAGHAEQGGWTRATLARRLAEPWFDPTLFLLAFDAEGLAGFNWLKIHFAQDGNAALGEIYVIGVDPRMQGARLGPALAVAGLDAVNARGVEIGMLFVAADNEPALKLYRSLGFTVHRVDRAYELAT
jgi:mycothiol synthase